MAIRDPGRRQIPASLPVYVRSPGRSRGLGRCSATEVTGQAPSARLDEEVSKGDSFRGLSFPFICICGKSVGHPEV